jgi:hypothetical protein
VTDGHRPEARAPVGEGVGPAADWCAVAKRSAEGGWRWARKLRRFAKQ